MGTTNRAKEASQEAQEDVGRRKEEARDVEDHVKRGNRRGGKALSAVLAGGSAYLSLRAVNHWWLVLRRKLLRDIFLTVVPVLNETNVDYWADFGTLLGMHREGDLILHDNDVDVVLLDPDWKEIIPALEKTLESRGYQLKVTETVDKETGKLYTWVRVWGLCGAFADLYAANLCQDGDMIKLYNEGLKIPKRLIFPRRSMRFRGTEVSVPGRIEDVLEYRYGEDYMVPKYMEKGGTKKRTT
eukprot:jgi/Pico_ML_1/54557/g4889.t1